MAKEKIVEYKKIINTVNKRNDELEFQLELSLTEAEINIAIIRIELNNKKRPV